MKNDTQKTSGRSNSVLSWMKRVALAFSLALMASGGASAAVYDVCIYDAGGGACGAFGTDLCSASYVFNPGPQSSTFSLPGVTTLNNITFTLYWTCDPGNFEYRLNGNLIGTSSFFSGSCTCTPGAFGTYPQTVVISGAAATPFWNFGGTNTLTVQEGAGTFAAVAGYKAAIDYTASGGGGGSGSTSLCIFDAGGGACGAFGTDLCAASYQCGPFSSSNSVTIPTATSISSIVYTLYWTCDPGSFTYRLNGNVIGSSAMSSGACTCTPGAFGSYPQTVTIAGAAADPFWIDGGSNVLSIDHTGGACVAGYSAVINWSSSGGGGSGPCLSQNWSSGLAGWSSASLVGGVNSWQINSVDGSGVPLGSLAAGAPNNGSTFGFEHSAMTSPAFSVTAGAVLNFRTWQCNEYSFYDREHVEISTDGGATWNILIDYTDGLWASSSTWTNATVTIPYTSSNARLRFRYNTVDGCCGCAGGWFVDDVVISGCGPSCTVNAGADVAVCAGSSTTLSATATPAGGSYSWSPAAGLSCTTCANPVATPGTTTTYTVTYTSGSCSASDAVVVTVNPLPNASFTGLPTAMCTSDAPVTLVPTVAGGTFSGPGVSGSTFSPAAAGGGSKTITYTVTVAGCTSSSSATVNVTVTPNAAFTVPTALCTGDAAVALVPLVAGGTFSGPGVSGSTFNPATAGPGTHTISYTVCGMSGSTSSYDFATGAMGWTTGNNATTTFGIASIASRWAHRAGFGTPAGCMGTDNIGSFGAENSWIMSPVLTFGAGPVTVAFSSFSNNESGFPSSYDVEWVEISTDGGATWTAMHGSISGLHDVFGDATWRNLSVTATVAATTNGRIRFRYDTGDGCCGPATANLGWYVDNVSITAGTASCCATSTKSVTVVATPSAAFTGLPANACADGAVITLTPATSGGTFSGPGVSGSTFNPAVAGPGVHTVTYNVCSAGGSAFYGFTSSAEGWTTGNQPTTVFGIASIASRWAHRPAMGTPVGAMGTDNAGSLGAEHSWIMSPPLSFAAGTVSVAFSSFSNNESGFPSNYDVENVEISTDGGATWTLMHGFITGLHDVFNDGIWRSFTVSASVAPTANGRIRFRYDTGDGCCGGSGVNNGWYVDNVNITGLAGGVSCCASSSQTINVAPTANASFTGLPTSICLDGGTVTLTPAQAGGTFSGPGMSGSTFNPAVAGVGTHTITYTIVTGPVCVYSTSQTVTVNPVPTANAGPDQFICYGETTTIGTSGSSYSYSFDAGAEGWTTGNQPTTSLGLGSIASRWTHHAGFGTPAGSMGNDNIGSFGAENSWIMSPVLTFGGGPVTVNFSSFSNNESGFPTFYDVEWVEVSTDGGATWTAMHGLVTGLHDVFGSATWINHSVSASVTATSNGRIRFRYDTGDGCCGPFSANLGWYVDNVAITSGGGGGGTFSWSPTTGLSCPTCATTDASPTATTTYTLTVTNSFGCDATDDVTVTVNPELVLSVVSPPYACGYSISCNGANDGRTVAMISGGTTPYTYLWSNGATTQFLTGLAPGTYSVTVTDAAGCSVSGSVTLTEPATLVSSGTVSTYACGYNVSCNGSNDGSIDLSASGGADCLAYTYAWSNGATTEDVSGLTAGSYSVTVTDANGCTSTSSFTLTEPAALTGTLTPSMFACGYNISCYGTASGSISTAVAGGCGPYTFSWSNGSGTQDVMGLPAGTYIVTITDANGCVLVLTQELTQPAELLSNGVATTYACGHGVSCFGASDGSINLSPSGGASCIAYTYVWSNGATTEDLSGLTAGTYSVTVTDANGCTATQSFTLTEPAPFVGSGVVSVYACGYNVSCNGAADGSINYTVSGGCAPYSFVWSNGATTEDLSGLTAGTYSVTATDANGCSNSASFTLTEPAPVVVDAGPNVTVYAGYSPLACTTLNGTAATGGCGPYTYTWSTSSGVISTSLSVTVCPTVTTTYYFTATDANGCIGLDSVRVCVIDVVCGMTGGGPKITICHTPPGTDATMCVPLSAVPGHLGHGDYIGPCTPSGTHACEWPAPAKTSSAQAAEEEAQGVRMTAFPNPFSTSTTVEFTLPSDDYATLKVYSLTGIEVGTLFEGYAAANGKMSYEFNPQDIADGIYIAKLETQSGQVQTLKLVLQK